MKHMRAFIREMKRIIAAYLSQPVSIYAAAVAYYTVFSLAPILIIVIAIAGFFLNSATAKQTVLTEFSSTFGQSGSEFIRTLIDAQSGTSAGIVATVVGLVFVVLGATGIFGALQTALDSIFRSLPEKQEKGLIATLWEKVTTIGMVLSIGFVLLASLAISSVLGLVGTHLDRYIPDGSTIITLVNFGVTFVLISLFLGALIKFLPTRRLPWRPALLGGVIAGAGFMLGKFLLGIYFAHSAATSAYGAASAIVLIILWAFYLSQVFFLAAILTQVYFLPHHHARRKKQY